MSLSILLSGLVTDSLRSQTEKPTVTDSLEEVLLTDLRYRRPPALAFSRDTVKYYDRFQDNGKMLFDREPGLLAINGENFAQDIRISVRGYGSRSAFGIRGLRMYLDGIPLTSPDGTTQIDELSLFDLASLEVVRSGLAARLGNAAGGALTLKTSDITAGMEVSGRLNSFGSRDLGAKYGIEKNNFKSILSINHHIFKSKREHSDAISTTLLWKSRINLTDKWQLDVLQSGYYSPLGNDPGALTDEEFRADPYAASQRNVIFKAGESVSGFGSAVKSALSLSDKVLLLSGIYLKKRYFEGRIPVVTGGTIDLDRLSGGIWNTLEINAHDKLTLTVGQTADYQNDNRTLNKNNNGVRGEVTADQKERVINFGFFQQAHLALKKLYIQQMLRYDVNRYRLDDYFPADGTQHGNLLFNNLNGSLGLGWELAENWVLFAHLGTNFEMPTLNELSNNPEGTGGFNPGLAPEQSIQGEVGIKAGILTGTTLNLSFFRILVDDQITAYELNGIPGRTFYRNAGKTHRNGLEWEVRSLLRKDLTIRLNGFLYDFTFSEYKNGSNDYAGNKQPLVPGYKLYGSLEWQISSKWQAMMAITRQARMYLDDANQVQAPAQTLINLGTQIKAGCCWSMGLTANNVFSLFEYSNFRQNAAAGRYFEAASPFHMAVFFRYKKLN